MAADMNASYMEGLLSPWGMGGIWVSSPSVTEADAQRTTGCHMSTQHLLVDEGLSPANGTHFQ